MRNGARAQQWAMVAGMGISWMRDDFDGRPICTTENDLLALYPRFPQLGFRSPDGDIKFFELSDPEHLASAYEPARTASSARTNSSS